MSGYGYNNQGNVPGSGGGSGYTPPPPSTPPPPPPPPPTTPPPPVQQSEPAPPEDPPLVVQDDVEQEVPETIESTVPSTSEDVQNVSTPKIPFNRRLAEEKGPFAFQGYYPLYYTAKDARNASPTPNKAREDKGETTLGYHTHVLSGVTYYMPNGLDDIGEQFHGNYPPATQRSGVGGGDGPTVRPAPPGDIIDPPTGPPPSPRPDEDSPVVLDDFPNGVCVKKLLYCIDIFITKVSTVSPDGLRPVGGTQLDEVAVQGYVHKDVRCLNPRNPGDLRHILDAIDQVNDPTNLTKINFGRIYDPTTGDPGADDWDRRDMEWLECEHNQRNWEYYQGDGVGGYVRTGKRQLGCDQGRLMYGCNGQCAMNILVEEISVSPCDCIRAGRRGKDHTDQDDTNPFNYTEEDRLNDTPVDDGGRWPGREGNGVGLKKIQIPPGQIVCGNWEMPEERQDGWRYEYYGTFPRVQETIKTYPNFLCPPKKRERYNVDDTHNGCSDDYYYFINSPDSDFGVYDDPKRLRAEDCPPIADPGDPDCKNVMQPCPDCEDPDGEACCDFMISKVLELAWMQDKLEKFNTLPECCGDSDDTGPGDPDEPTGRSTPSRDTLTNISVASSSEAVNVLNSLADENGERIPGNSPAGSINGAVPTGQQFELRDSNGNFRVYRVGEVVLYNNELYEVIQEGFGKLPLNPAYFRKIEEEREDTIDGGSY